MLKSLYDECLHKNNDIAAALPLHSNQRNREIETYDYILERCDEPYVSYTHDMRKLDCGAQQGT